MQVSDVEVSSRRMCSISSVDEGYLTGSCIDHTQLLPFPHDELCTPTEDLSEPVTYVPSQADSCVVEDNVRSEQRRQGFPKVPDHYQTEKSTTCAARNREYSVYVQNNHYHFHGSHYLTQRQEHNGAPMANTPNNRYEDHREQTGRL